MAFDFVNKPPSLIDSGAGGNPPFICLFSVLVKLNLILVKTLSSTLQVPRDITVSVCFLDSCYSK